MSSVSPPLGRTPSIDQQKGPVAARRQIPIQPLNIPTPATTQPASNPTTTTTTTHPSSTTSNPAIDPSNSYHPPPPTSPPILAIPYSAEYTSVSAVPSMVVDMGGVPVTYPRSAEQRMEQEGGVLVSAAEDLRVFAQPVALHQQPNSHSSIGSHQ